MSATGDGLTEPIFDFPSPFRCAKSPDTRLGIWTFLYSGQNPKGRSPKNRDRLLNIMFTF